MKPDRIVFIDESLEDVFNSLKEDDPIKKALIKAIRDIKNNCCCRRNVKEELIPRKLIEKYGINNLWIYNLPSPVNFVAPYIFSGLIAAKEEIELVAVVLDWINHKDYEKLFGF